MATERPLSADQWMDVFRAESKLADLELHAELAEAAVSEPLPGLRLAYADQYRELLGVWPEDRGAFRAALERIRDGSGGSVDAVIGRLDWQRHANGLSIPDEGGEVSDEP